MPGYEYYGAIMITASHLPYNRNGFKLFTREGGFEKSDVSELLQVCHLALKINLILIILLEWQDIKELEVQSKTEQAYNNTAVLADILLVYLFQLKTWLSLPP